MRNSLDIRGGLDPLVDRMIGNAYPHVKCVAMNIEEVKAVAGALSTGLASQVMITADTNSQLIAGNVQDVLVALAARIKLLEG